MPRGVYPHKPNQLFQNGDKHPRWKGGVSNKEYLREYERKIRRSAIEALGGKCARCGFSDKRALQIDHINGGGSKERKVLGFSGRFHLHVLRSFVAKENRYQLLCANCNWIKRVENNETNI